MLDNKDHNEDAIDAFYKQKASGYYVSPVPNVFDAIIGQTSLAANDPIDSFYKEKSQGYKAEVSPNAFEQIMSKTTLPQNPSSSLLKPFKIGGMIMGVGAVTIAAWFGFSDKEKKHSIPVNNSKKNLSKEYVQPTSINEVSPKVIAPITNNKNEEVKTIKKKPIIKVSEPNNYSPNVVRTEPQNIINKIDDNSVNEDHINPDLETKVEPSKTNIEKSVVNDVKKESVINVTTSTEEPSSVEDNFSKFINKHNISDSIRKELFNEKEKK